MDRAGLGRWLLIGAGVFLVMTLFSNFFGNGEGALQPLRQEYQAGPAAQSDERLCDLWGPRFYAQLTTAGGAIKHFNLATAKYQKDGQPIDLSTTPDLAFRRQLQFQFRNEALGAEDADFWQVDYDLLNYELVRGDGKTCELSYRDPKVQVDRVVKTTGRPYEILVETTIKNLAERKLKHALTVHTVAWRTNEEVKGHMFRVSPFITHVECLQQDGSVTRLRPDDFEPEDFNNREHFPETQLNNGEWYEVKGRADVAAVSNAYFTHALVPISAPSAPLCQLQIEDRWDSGRYKNKGQDPKAGAMYRARLAYPGAELEPGQTANYRVLSYVGPKERDVLAAAGEGRHKLGEVIDLGFFSAIAKVLVAFLLAVYSLIPNWGIAIIVLTITARTLLFPLSIPSIRSMIKMRELKPEIDALNQKFKDDPQAKGLAQMELWRKHNVNPLKGCLPQLASMPVWFALYTTLQTAVELYNIPFLWFPDLSEPDPFYVLPFIIGGTSFIQQKIMPLQADPAQQKMMLYFMPAMFTVFMLFLPAGLGVYMFTNSLLGIIQQQAVEWHAKRTSGANKDSTDRGNTDRGSAHRDKGGSEIRVKVKEETAGKAAGRGNKRKKGGADHSTHEKLSRQGPLLGKGKA